MMGMHVSPSPLLDFSSGSLLPTLSLLRPTPNHYGVKGFTSLIETGGELVGHFFTHQTGKESPEVAV